MVILSGGDPYRVEVPPDIRSCVQDFYYLYDPNVGKWLSTIIETIPYGRNATVVAGFLRSVNGVFTDGTRGMDIPHDGTLVAVTGSANNTPTTNIKIQVYNNGSQIYQTGWLNPRFSVSCDEDFTYGNLSVNIDATELPNTPPNYPVVVLYAKWRL